MPASQLSRQTGGQPKLKVEEQLLRVLEYWRKLCTLEVELGWQVPAIALTGYAGKEWQERSLELGFQQYLTKPILPDALIEIVIQLLRQSE
ncbi:MULTISPECIES: hypothetical protein [Trichocoleus]|uniref:Response regulatory domain-containing protein n=1 Tax=Trichocoleus desertorum GB2-A4 TaxID=2933944 RepID=A0ABV0JFF4_9CYAN|nr:hypothetical protein [Trichocoleus sp. FACHB-46]MBD1865543.1 hypothetical protein [Trichocoleus sp. FACHB-46]